MGRDPLPVKLWAPQAACAVASLGLQLCLSPGLVFCRIMCPPWLPFMLSNERSSSYKIESEPARTALANSQHVIRWRGYGRTRLRLLSKGSPHKAISLAFLKIGVRFPNGWFPFGFP